MSQTVEPRKSAPELNNGREKKLKDKRYEIGVEVIMSLCNKWFLPIITIYPYLLTHNRKNVDNRKKEGELKKKE
jgi:hypothetical protein